MSMAEHSADGAEGKRFQRLNWFAPQRPVEGNTVFVRPIESLNATDDPTVDSPLD